jgi:two-component system, chemotaxis family, response regulator Rcp1
VSDDDVGFSPRLPCKSADILLVEDNPCDVLLTREALKEDRVESRLHVVQDGMEALAYLQKQGPFTDVPRPDLILLDLNLPKLNGDEVLAYIKNDPDLRCIPVVVLTTSGTHRDIFEAYNLHANCYIIKPLGLDQFLAAVKAVEEFWLTVATLPGGGR